MANEFVARKGIISLGDVEVSGSKSLTLSDLSGNNNELVSLDASGKLLASGLTSASIASDIAAAAGTFDLDFSGDSGTNGSVDNSQTFAIVGANGISTTSNGSQQLTISAGGPLVSGSAQVKALLPANTVSSSAQLVAAAAGQVATSNIANDAVTYAKIQNVAANSVLVRDANSVGSVSAKAVADTQILIGDGTGFTAASLSGDITMTNAGVVTIGNDKVDNAKLSNMAANTVKVRNANSSGNPSDLAVADTQILIGNGAGFTAAALSGDVSMTNAGAVTVGKIEGVDITSDEATQLANIGATTISAAQWGYVGDFDQGLASTNDVIFNTITVNEDVTISGDLTVLGSRTELQVSQLNVEDINILIASGAADSSEANNAGITVDGANATIKWNHTAQGFTTSHDFGVTGNLFSAGDTDTYFGFPAANRAAIYAGNNLGVYVDGQGDVGIGTDGGGNLLGAKITVAGNISGSGKLFLGTVATSTSETTALVLDGTEVKQRDLSTGAFVDVGNAATQDTGSMTVLAADTAGSATTATTATNANYINVDEKNDNVAYQVLFSDANGSGNQRPYIDTDNAHLTYNPNTHTLTAGTFSGNATSATTATNSTQLGGVTALGYVTTGSAQDISGQKTFTGGMVMKSALKIDTDATGTSVDITNVLDETVTNGVTTVATISDSYKAVFFDYALYRGTAAFRAGTVMVACNGSTLTYTDFSTAEGGSGTLDIEWQASINGSNQIILEANNSGQDAAAHVYIRALG